MDSGGKCLSKCVLDAVNLKDRALGDRFESGMALEERSKTLHNTRSAHQSPHNCGHRRHLRLKTDLWSNSSSAVFGGRRYSLACSIHFRVRVCRCRLFAGQPWKLIATV